jgi:hypothetical protein
MQKNNMYNDFLNSGNIILGMSGGEGWGLPEFQSVAIGKHAVILNAHAYKEWANENNSTLVEPNGKIEAYDGMFFHKDQPFNQGNIFDFDQNDFISACEKSIEKVKPKSPIKNVGFAILLFIIQFILFYFILEKVNKFKFFFISFVTICSFVVIYFLIVFKKKFLFLNYILFFIRSIKDKKDIKKYLKFYKKTNFL